MPITVRKQDGDIKFYGSQVEPILIIYDKEEGASLNYAFIGDVRTAKEISEAVMIAGFFISAILNKDSADFKTNNIEVEYLNEGDQSYSGALYSPRKILNWIESNKVVTINKRLRIRYRFTKFAYRNEKLVILYKPVVW